jgi:hypothetical protein
MIMMGSGAQWDLANGRRFFHFPMAGRGMNSHQDFQMNVAPPTHEFQDRVP